MRNRRAVELLEGNFHGAAAAAGRDTGAKLWKKVRPDGGKKKKRP